MSKRLSLRAMMLTAICIPAVVSQASISVLDNMGNVYNVSTSTGAATLLRNVGDPASNSTQFSPNGLGVSGANVYYATFNAAGPNEYVFGDTWAGGTAVAPAGSAIAAGDVSGTNYYFLGNGNLYTVDTTDGSFDGSSLVFTGGANYGDLAINGNFAYLSYQVGSNDVFAAFDLTDPTNTFASTSFDRYLGLGFDGNTLYGVNNFLLQELSVNYDPNAQTLTVSKVGASQTITGIESGANLTDASRSVVPEASTIAVWSILSLVGAGVAYRKRLHK